VMHHIFRNFIDSLSCAPDGNGLRDAMAGASAALDLSCFAYLATAHHPGSSPTLITNYPTGWTEHYLRGHYERFDPVIMRALSNTEPFEWGLGTGTGALSKLRHKLSTEAVTFGIRYGFTVPIHDNRGAIAAVTFAIEPHGGSFRHE
jgi:LuxR family transcriptional regulator, activator of conjugal transfer of Ti plasmids